MGVWRCMALVSLAVVEASGQNVLFGLGEPRSWWTWAMFGGFLAVLLATLCLCWVREEREMDRQELLERQKRSRHLQDLWTVARPHARETQYTMETPSDGSAPLATTPPRPLSTSHMTVRF